MGGIAIVVVGFEATKVIDNYIQNLGCPPGLSSFKHLLRDLESKIYVPISLARLEDSNSTKMFICCYVAYDQEKVYDCEELMAMEIPPDFFRVKGILGFEGPLKRVFAPKAMIFSYDCDGRSRVKEGITVIGPTAENELMA